MKKTKKKMTAEELDKKFDEGKEDVLKHFDLKTARMDYPVQRINIDIPQVILNKVDRVANRAGVSRTSLLKWWIAEKADRLAG